MNAKIIAIIVGLILFVMLFRRKNINATANEFIMDTITKKKIAELHPAIQAKAIEFIKRAENAGIKVRIYSALRTFAEQQTLFNYPIDGIDNDRNGRIDDAGEKVTNAKPGDSFHNYGLAFDAVAMENGKAIWDVKNPIWETIGKIGESVGLEWGGRWKFVDMPHFQIMNFPLSHAKRNYAAEKFDSKGFILLT
jgi:peptidoglycan LD-endopeptidase CwlK